MPMTSEEILKQVNAHREKQSALQQEWEVLRNNAREECLRLIEVFDFTASELQLGKDGHSIKIKSPNAGEPKFQNPDGPETWTGRGKRPKWYIAAQEAGFTDEEMLIKKPEAPAAE